MKLHRFCIVITLFCIASPVFAEYVFLKSGKVVEGKIVEDKARTVVVLKADGSREEVARDDILRINYTKMYTGKLSIMKSNEEVFDAYIVEEDQNTVTFRTEWESPREFTMNRDDILFMTRKNPTALRVKNDGENVDLRWTPPFMDVDRYNIYIKEGDGVFRNAGDTSSKKFTVDAVKKDTLYTVRITAKDDSGYESLPSKESVFYGTPLDLTYEIIDDPSGDTYSVIIRWKPLAYKGKDIKQYGIFRFEKDVILEAGKTDGLEFTLKGLRNDEFNLIEIRPLTPDGYSIEGNVVEIPGFYYREQSVLSLHGAYFLPFSDFRDVTDPGFGVYADFMFCNYFMKHFSFGIETGFFFFPGREGEASVREAINSFIMVPLLARIQFGISPLQSLSFYVSAGAGYSWNSINYDSQVWESGSFVTREVESSEFEPLVSGSIMAEWQALEWLTVTARCDYNIILEGKVKYQFVSFGAGAGYSF